MHARLCCSFATADHDINQAARDGPSFEKGSFASITVHIPAGWDSFMIRAGGDRAYLHICREVIFRVAAVACQELDCICELPPKRYQDDW